MGALITLLASVSQSVPVLGVPTPVEGKPRLKLHSVIAQTAAPGKPVQSDVNIDAQLIARCENIFVGEVAKADLSQGTWSGFYTCYKPVEFKVKKTAKGNVVGTPVTVKEVLVKENQRVLKSAQLSPEFYAVGSEIIVFVESTKMEGFPDRFYIGDAQPYSDTLWESVLKQVQSDKQPVKGRQNVQ